MKKYIVLGISTIIFITASVLSYKFFYRLVSLDYLYFTLFILGFGLLIFSVSYVFIDRLKKENIINKKKLDKWRETSIYINHVSEDIVNELPVGIIIYDDTGEIKWNNRAAVNLLLGNETAQTKITSIIPDILKGEFEFIFENRGKFFKIIHCISQKSIYVFDTTSEELLKIKVNLSTMCMGILHFENINQVLSKVDVTLESGIRTLYLGLVFTWAQKYNCYVRPFTDEKISIITTKEKLMLMINDGFDILDTVRNTSAINNYRISLSGGFACYDIGPEELSNYTNNTLELAQKRGGDQIAINIQGQKIEFFGAKVERRHDVIDVNVKMNATSLVSIMNKYTTILAMSHKDTDLDSFGSMLLIYKIAQSINKKCHIVLDSNRIESLTNDLLELLRDSNNSIISNIVNERKALSLMNDDVLLIIVDTQNKAMLVSESVFEKALNIIVIDHHRSENDSIIGSLNLIDTNSSSVVETLLCMSLHLEHPLNIDSLEANILYAAIIVDTQNLLNKTTSSTFESLKYLVGYGAEPSMVKQWLRKDFDTINHFNKILSSAIRYKDKYLFVVYEEILTSVEISQLCDMGLEVGKVEACFAIGKISKDTTKVSARSYPSVNVLAIIESLDLGGGGHFTSAALVTSQKSIQELIESIQRHIENEITGGENTMKIILLEDIKDRGKTNDIIDVKAGYGNFLITNKKALLATKENVAILYKKLNDIKKAEEQVYKTMLVTKKNIDGKLVFVKIHVGMDSKLFGAITTAKIADAFNEQHGILIDKKRITLNSEITSLGIYQATVSLHKDIKACFTVEVIAE